MTSWGLAGGGGAVCRRCKLTVQYVDGLYSWTKAIVARRASFKVAPPKAQKGSTQFD